MIEFTESRLVFRFPSDNCFRIEQDPLVAENHCASTSNNMGCECVSLINGHLCFIEVKSSAPKGPSGNVKDVRLNDCPVPRNWFILDNYRNYLREISKKFIDSSSIVRAVMEGRHGHDRQASLMLPPTRFDFARLRFILILNLCIPDGKSVRKESLGVLQDALKNEMRPFLRIWQIPDTAVKVVIPEDAKVRLHIPLQLPMPK